ncbi:winged helix-turn-helix transcriptional regulator [Flavobacterium rivuli]|uniref:winged helix-turn-helix transcriptional regulator n=1 Tax=Flavobacterium rivuli TaxID=498301 RepID=UPI00035E2879|nr:winged helix-turn-helix transcriptional regulator [Flavobacterium rivuli]
MSGISPKVLSKELQDFEENLLITRTVNKTKPVTVSYALTEHAAATHPVINALIAFGLKHRIEIKKVSLLILYQKLYRIIIKQSLTILTTEVTMLQQILSMQKQRTLEVNLGIIRCVKLFNLRVIYMHKLPIPHLVLI